jgi:hypothetical protein
MNSKVLSFVNKCEGWKTAIKSLHWDSKNLSQHKLCDDIADKVLGRLAEENGGGYEKV